MEYGSQVQSNLGEQQLAAFNEFLSKHDRLLSELRSQNETETTFSKDSIPRLERTQFRPIHVQFDTSECENISIFQLIDSENKVLNKLLVVFADLCMEARKLRKSYMNYNVGYLCVDDDLAEMEVNGVDSMQFLAKFSEHFEFFNNIKCYLQRCILVANNIIKQLSALFVEEKFYTNVQGSLHFQSAFNALADLILILISFDEIISSSYIVKNWTHCKKVLTTLTTFENEDPLDGLEMVLNDFEYLFSCCFYQSLTDGTFGLTQVADKKSLVTFACHFISYIKNNLALLLQSPNSPENNKIEMTESDEISLLVKLNGMIVLYHNMFGNLDVKYVKQLIECNIKRCDITLTGSIIWQPEIFFQRHASTLIKKIGNHLFTEKDLKRVRLNQLQAHGQSLSKNTQLYAMQVVLWNLKIMELPKSNSPSVKFDDVKEKFYLLLEGLQIASKISQLVCSVTNLHTFLKSPMQKSYLNDLCRLIEFLKTIKTTYDKNLCAIQRITTTITQYFMYQILHIVVAKRKKLTLPGSQKGANNKTERLCDILSALQLVERCLHGPATIARLLVARLALCASDPNSTFTIEQLKKLVKLFHRLEWIVDFQSKIDTICSTNFLYWHQMIISFYLKQLVTKDQPVVNCSISDKLLTMVHSAIDCEESMAVIKRNYPAILSDNFKNNIEYEQSLVNEIKAEITSKLCAEVETQLRLESYLRIQERYDNNDGKSASLKPQLNDAIDIHSYFPLPIIQFGKKHVSIQNNIENYLSKMFYNLTTVSLHNWRTYGDMRHLARLKYSLITVEDYLPNQTLEQGLDVLEIMRNIHIFVSKYCYNLNNQIFVERTSNNKHLNTISIPHIANSLRTHGTGIINTTVNFTYQFLRKKFSIFSQFLYDEQIKSRLIKDLKYFRSNADKISQTYYPYDRACTFNRSIRRLGLDDKGQSYLDLYRILITQIGNAVGYVRMMQSGVVNCCSTASFYLPPLEEGFLNPEEYKEFDENTVIAINNLRNTINHLLNINTFDKREDSSSIKNGSNVGSQETKKSLNYLKILVDVFIPVMRNSKNVHLKLFYLILPPLIVNYVEYMIVMKHKLNKKVLTRMIESKGSQGDKDEVIFTEDGFAMGLVYILKLLDQTEDFNSLHWFKSVKQMYNEKLRQTQEESKELAKGGSHQDATKLQETMHLTQKRIQTFQQEYDLLFYNLSSAKIFFQ